MVLYEIRLRANEIEGVRSIHSDREVSFLIDLCDGTNPEERRDRVAVTSIDSVEVPNTKGTTCNFRLGFGDRKANATVDIIPSNFTDGRFEIVLDEDEDLREGKPFVTFETRRCEVVSFHMGPGFQITGRSGQVFDNIDLSEDFFEYDVAAGCPVMISGMYAEIRKYKK